MRICIYDPYIDTLGGGEHVLAALAETLEGLYPEGEIDLLVHEPPRTRIEELERRFAVGLSRVRYRVEPFPGRSLWGRLLPGDLARRIDIERRFSSVTGEYDLFFNNCIFSTMPSRAKTSIYICMFPLHPGVRGRHGSLARPFHAAYGWLRGAYYRRVARGYDQIWANSQYTREWIRRLWGAEAAVVYPPVDVGLEPEILRRENLILSVGRFFPGDHNKKHGPMLDGFRRLCDEGLRGWQLHLAGGVGDRHGTMEYIQDLTRRAAGYPVSFHFNASAADLARLRESAKIFWHATGYEEDAEAAPDKLEHFGMSTVEAMSRGIVPIVIAMGGQPEIVRHGIDGLLWRDLDELVAQTRMLAADEGLRVKLAAAARAGSRRFDRALFRAEVSRRLGF